MRRARSRLSRISRLSALCWGVACSSAPPPAAPPPVTPALSTPAPSPRPPRQGRPELNHAEGEGAGERAPAFTPEGLSAHISAALRAQGCGGAPELFVQMGDMVEAYLEEGGPFLSYLAQLPTNDMRVRIQRAELIADFSSQLMRRYELLEVIARACPSERPALLERRERLARRLTELTQRAPSPR